MNLGAGKIVYVNGRFKSIDDLKLGIYNQSFHYGNGVLEGLRSYKTEDGVNIFRAKEHFSRFLKTASHLGMTVPYSEQELINVAYKLLEENEYEEAYIRPMALPGDTLDFSKTARTNVILLVTNWDRVFDEKLISMQVSNYRKPGMRNFLNRSKIIGQYSQAYFATEEARKSGYDEALLLDVNGHICQAPVANVFIEKDGVLYTPPTTYAMPGLTRETVFTLAAEMHIEVREKLMTPSFIQNADGAFITGTAVEITGVKSIDQSIFQQEWEESIGFMIKRRYKLLASHPEKQYSNYL